ncbi:MAG TPA: hypothetical protein VGU69_17815 [Rhizomicrobium sp.]|nr:hypothetical protein [Rhizomicrobium sp.]
MGLFDNIEANLDSIAGKVGITPDQVRSITNTFQANLTSTDGNPLAAIEATAAAHGITTGTIHEILNHGGGLQSELGDVAGSLFRAGQ